MRTQKQIIADCEARFEQLRTEAQSPAILYPCSTCKWGRKPALYWRCYNTLVVGFNPQGYVLADNEAALCGPEKALWEPIPTRWDKFWQWIGFHRVEG